MDFDELKFDYQQTASDLVTRIQEADAADRDRTPARTASCRMVIWPCPLRRHANATRAANHRAWDTCSA
jgi:hypothetical protein